MIELVFVTCLSAAAQSTPACHERSLIFVDVSPMMCVLGAQPQLARWIETHPGERILSWRCRVVQPGETDA